jgi:hypothetical protein
MDAFPVFGNPSLCVLGLRTWPSSREGEGDDLAQLWMEGKRQTLCAE